MSDEMERVRVMSAEALSVLEHEDVETATELLYDIRRVADFHSDDSDDELSPLEEWREHNEAFAYEPPDKPAEAWSSDEYRELYDRLIRREVKWLCAECSGRGPFGSLEKARRHVQSDHGEQLVEKYAPTEEELEDEES